MDPTSRKSTAAALLGTGCYEACDECPAQLDCVIRSISQFLAARWGRPRAMTYAANLGQTRLVLNLTKDVLAEDLLPEILFFPNSAYLLWGSTIIFIGQTAPEGYSVGILRPDLLRLAILELRRGAAQAQAEMN